MHPLCSLPGIGSVAAVLRLFCLLLLLTTSLRAEFDPALVKVMEKADIFGTEPFEGDVSVNAQGRWIAASQNGVFLKQANTQGWQEVLTPSGGKLVNSSTLKIHCRISDAGNWVVINRSGIYKNGISQISNPSSSNIGGNIAYWSLDMNEQGDWVSISSRATFLNATRISVPENPDGSTTIEAYDVGEMVVKITDQNLSNNFIWMAISPGESIETASAFPASILLQAKLNTHST